MGRLRFMSPYLKGGKDAAKLANRTRYVATRPGVELLKGDAAQRPATKKQQAFIKRLLRDFPTAEEMLEYEDYLNEPTQANAHELIHQVWEEYIEVMERKENYLDYIANRPGVQLDGAHGLWDLHGKVENLQAAVREVAEHTGNVWTPVVAIRREDAERLGYANAANWQQLVNASLADIAKGYKIHPDHLRWYAAFHEKEKQVHIHMVVFSSNPREGYLTKDGIRQVRGVFARQIFRQELICVYEKKTEYRNRLQEDAEQAMAELIRQMRSGTLESPKLERLVTELAERLSATSGKKVYGYLPPRVKTIVDEIVDELAKDERVSSAYALWQQMHDEVCHVYAEPLPERMPLSKQKEFKPVRNMVIRETLKLTEELYFSDDAVDEPELLIDDDPTPEDEPQDSPQNPVEKPEMGTNPFVAWSDTYREARTLLYGRDDVPPDHARALELLAQEAERGNALAMCDLGRMYADGLGCEADTERSRQWYARGLTAFLGIEEQEPDRYIEYRIGKLYASGFGTKQDHEQAARWFMQAAGAGYKYAQYSLAGLFYRGCGVDQDCGEARQLYEKAARQGFAYANFELAKMLRDGIGCEADPEKAAVHFRRAYLGFRTMEKQSQDDRLQYRIGWMLLNGVGTEKDEPAAREYFEKAAQLGNAHAAYQLGKLTLADDAADEQTIRDAIEQLHRIAEDGHEGAQYALGKLYRDGDRVKRDLAEAIRWFTRTAERGNEYAQYALGKLLLERGNTKAALEWLEKSAVQGNQYAQYTLGKLYLLGKEVPRDREQAVEWLTKSAAQGNTYAQFFLNQMDQFRDPSVGMALLRMLYHMGRIFEDNSKTDAMHRGIQIDRKRCQQLREKKLAMGHRADDHENEEIRLR